MQPRPALPSYTSAVFTADRLVPVGSAILDVPVDRIPPAPGRAGTGSLALAGDQFSVQFPARLGEIGPLISMIEIVGRWHDAPPAVVYGLSVVVDELVANVVRHAGPAPGALLRASVAFSGDSVGLVFDWPGDPFDPVSFVPPALDAGPDVDDRPVGGLGLCLVQAFAQEMLYRRDGDRNIVSFVRRYDRDCPVMALLPGEAADGVFRPGDGVQ